MKVKRKFINIVSGILGFVDGPWLRRLTAYRRRYLVPSSGQGKKGERTAVTRHKDLVQHYDCDHALKSAGFKVGCF
jgi:hypothetical protein